MTESPVPACLIVDDVPINASYWWRLQQTGFGFKPTDDIWGDQWRNQADAALAPVALFEAFADLADEFDLKGKFTMLPRPAALGRLDERIRGYADDELAKMLDIVRSRIQPRFDITPEVLTHTMAMDPATGALRPHSETAWVSHLTRTGERQQLTDYIAHAFEVLKNAGLSPTGLTVGGMTDPSGIAAGEMVVHGFNLQQLAESLAVAATQSGVTFEHDGKPAVFFFVGGEPTTKRGQAFGLPEPYETDAARVFNLYSVGDEPLAPLYRGVGDVEATADALITADLASGRWVDAAEAGRVVVATIHDQTLNSRNTQLGLKALRLALGRLKERYGSRLAWHRASSLCALPTPTPA